MKKRQSDSGVIRVHLPWIEQQIANGVRHEAIVEELAGMGFPMKLPTFRTGLVRERAKVKEGKVGMAQGGTSQNLPAGQAQEEQENNQALNKGSEVGGGLVLPEKKGAFKNTTSLNVPQDELNKLLGE